VEADRTCEAFEPLRCHVLISESTFGLPIYRWRPEGEVFAQINEWWRGNAQQGRTSVVLAYALGKAQRVLSGLDEGIGPIAVHGAVGRMNRAYQEEGIRLPAAGNPRERIKEIRGRGLVVGPPSAAGAGSRWLRGLAGPEGVSLAMASGWMQVRGGRRRRAVDRGFVLSDHADWNGLVGTIRASGAERVGVTHGYIEPLARWVREGMGLESFAVATRFEGERLEEGEQGSSAEPEEA
jgi:putative mRNA 3-end processing factor